MTEAGTPRNRPGEESADEKRHRKPYEKPRITFREPLEGVAAICNPPGKGSPPCEFASS